jgi:hypothetical protein
MEHSIESLNEGEVSRGRLYRTGQNHYGRKSFDIIGSFLDVLGKRTRDVPENFEKGEVLVDTAMDLETNTTKGLARENSLLVECGPVPPDSVVKIAQTFRSGTNDIDAIDFAELFLADEDQVDPDELNELYVLVNFRPAVTNKNWRMDCGVAGYDNSSGLPPFFPTRLRFEDYIFRIWIQQDGLAAAHVDAAQNHTRSNYMRDPAAAEIFNEEVSNLLKRKIKASVTRIDELGIAFDYEGEVTDDDARSILDKVAVMYGKALEAAERASRPERKEALRLFATNLQEAFYSFEPDFFQQNLLRILGDVVSTIKGSIELWPSLVEMCYFEQNRRGLPWTKVNNRRLGRGEARPSSVIPLHSLESFPCESCKSRRSHLDDVHFPIHSEVACADLSVR